METFGEKIRDFRKSIGLDQKQFSSKLGISNSFLSDVENGRSVLSYDVLRTLSLEYHISLDWLVAGELDPEFGPKYRGSKGNGIHTNTSTDYVLIPLLDQRVSAGAGQQLIDAKTIGEIPFVARMLRGYPMDRAKAIECRGDSMTGIHLNDGDLVVFVQGDIRGDGIYVIRIGDELYVKRIEFDPIDRKIYIQSENPRYQTKTVSADDEAIEIVGKVYGWVHAHPH